ncbi:MAG: hypothetical protein ACP5QO_08580 [Clostridia bacterium]
MANSAAPDALALTIGSLFWVELALTLWIPGWNRVSRYRGVHRFIRQFDHDHRGDRIGGNAPNEGMHHG